MYHNDTTRKLLGLTALKEAKTCQNSNIVNNTEWHNVVVRHSTTGRLVPDEAGVSAFSPDSDISFSHQTVGKKISSEIIWY